jgi:hypothetical protein
LKFKKLKNNKTNINFNYIIEGANGARNAAHQGGEARAEL